MTDKPMTRPVRALRLAIVLLLCGAASLTSAEIRFTEAVRVAAPERSLAGKPVPSFGVVPFRFSKAAASSRAENVARTNPVSASIRAQKFESAETDEDVVFSAGPFEFWVNKATGSEILLNLDRYAEAEQQKEPVEEAVLIRRATEYVKSQLTEVDSREVRLLKIKRQMDSVGQVDARGQPTGEIKERVANHIVIFERVIGQIPVVGPGEKIRVYFASNGEAIGHSKIWRRLGKAAPGRPVLPAETIRASFAAAHEKYPGPGIEVDRIYFGYYAAGRYTRQETLSPVYILGYTYGPYSKRVLEIFDAYTGKVLQPIDEDPGDAKPAK
jgi:hypothetical protein